MALLSILRYPDPRLHTVAKPVAAVDARIRRLVDDMLDTMYAAEGVGLAATQVDVHERVIVIDTSDTRDDPRVLINPEIVARSDEMMVGDEGCLSVPMVYDKVQRHARVAVRALNRDGESHQFDAEGLLSVCVQHEMDHLLGKVFVEYLSPLKRNRIKTKMLKKTRDEQRVTRTSDSPLRVTFAGTPEFAAAALARLDAAGFAIPLVLTQPDRPAGRGLKLQASPVKALADSHGIPVAQPRGLRLDGRFADDAQAAREQLLAARADVMVVAAYGLILPTWVLDMPRLGCLNIHASLLPRWRGAAPIHRAIEAGDELAGVTIMQMDAGLDTGAMLLAEATPITPHDTTASLQDRLAALGARLIVEALELAVGGALHPTPQPTTGVTYAHKIHKGEAAIDWTQPAEVIERRIRAFDPFPGASGLFEGEVIKCWRAQALSGRGAPGLVLAVSAVGVDVACGDGVLRLTELQRPGGKRLPVRQFLQGKAIAPGQAFSARSD